MDGINTCALEGYQSAGETKAFVVFEKSSPTRQGYSPLIARREVGGSVAKVYMEACKASLLFQLAEINLGCSAISGTFLNEMPT